MIFIVAEIGSCHDGSLEKAKELIDLAYISGCNGVKGQYCSDPKELACKRGVKPIDYPWSVEKDWLAVLKDYCGERIEWMCTTYLIQDIEVVDPYVKRFKIAAAEKDDQEFITAHYPFAKPIIISGISLHCVSEYPCPDEHAQLKKIEGKYGYSDHTKNPLSGALAAALGAMYIETHIRLDTTSPSSPDYTTARSPAELKRYIDYVRQAEVLLG